MQNRKTRIRQENRQGQVQLNWAGKAVDPSLEGPTDASVQGSAPDLITVQQFGTASGSLLIAGDAATSMDALIKPGPLCTRGQVQLCYIDPPYNTGERFNHYADRMDRSSWLSALQCHLTQIKQLISNSGSVWVHLDDSEQHRARCVLDEVFGTDAFVATIIWQKRTSRDNRKAFSSMHDYIHVYAPAGPVAWKRIRNGLPDTGTFSNPDGDPRGPWRSIPMSVQAGHATAAQFYTVVTPTGKRHEPPPGRCWTYTASRLKELDSQGLVYWPRAGDGKPRLKRFASDVSPLAPFTIWDADEVGTTASAKKALQQEFPNVPAFDTPKPRELLERIVAIGSNPGDVVLDCYLGSGTTALAAQALGRRWIGIEQSRLTVERVALPRLRRAVLSSSEKGFEFMSCTESRDEANEVGA
ncbi:site-specific DNA-methyltransferase [Mycolicibacterium mageritense]|uniref:site-specific DNA-methyltransferase n=1 Tax=Mycolicibacterium mageritense TaxID=53462 RepID=UPI0011D41DF6|nr:site-specific DNA-methyltransferase [Mycolicibacterium mageritense]TXI63761.1 MAG: site-specific DNA-methyltransferase [Mycolicibacterium mageritense]